MHEEISYNHPALFSCRDTAPKIDGSQRSGLPHKHGPSPTLCHKI